MDARSVARFKSAEHVASAVVDSGRISLGAAIVAADRLRILERLLRMPDARMGILIMRKAAAREWADAVAADDALLAALLADAEAWRAATPGRKPGQRDTKPRKPRSDRGKKRPNGNGRKPVSGRVG